MNGMSVLLVCTSCRALGSDPGAPRPGAALLQAVRASAPDGSAPAVRGVTCLSGCKRPCCVALLAEYRVSYLFGDLPADAASAAELLEAARHHAVAPDGWMPRANRPERLRAGILARIPPMSWIMPGQDGPVAWPT